MDDIERLKKENRELKNKLSTFIEQRKRRSKFIKKGVTVSISFLLLFLLFSSIPVMIADTPVVAYTSIEDGELLVPVIPNTGVQLNVSVNDTDGNLQSVSVEENSSGSWTSVYSSGALGGVYDYDVNITVSAWIEGMTTYHYRIVANDGSDHTFGYSFQTGYIWGDAQLTVLDDYQGITQGEFFKFDDGDYYLWTDYTGFDVLKSSLGTDFILQSSIDITDDYSQGPYDSFIYDNMPHVYFTETGYDGHLHASYYNGSDFNIVSTGIRQRDKYKVYSQWGDWYFYGEEYGAAVKYFDGEWHIVAAQKTCSYSSSTRTYSRLYDYASQTPTSAGTSIKQFYNTDSSPIHFRPSLEVHDSLLHMVCKDTGNDLAYWTFDGSDWTSHGDIQANIESMGTIVKDYINDQLVIVYDDGPIYYRIYNGSGWSEPQVVFTPKPGTDIIYPSCSYVDKRLVVTFGYNLRGNWNLYSVSAPDYTKTVYGLDEEFNRIMFPDTTPTATNVESTPFTLKNDGRRDVETITWHVADIGDVETANNARVWTNMSGSWKSYSVGSDQNTSTIDISGLTGDEWQPGEFTYWKLEILDMGGVAETLHTTDEDIYYWITLTPD